MPKRNIRTGFCCSKAVLFPGTMPWLPCTEGDSVPQNSTAAFGHFKRAADQGSARGRFNYGLSLWNGDGAAKDSAKAISYIKQAADQGYAPAQNCYGRHLRQGLGVPRNLALAIEYFKMAADQGNADGQRNYDECMEECWGRERAARWERLEANQEFMWAEARAGIQQLQMQIAAIGRRMY